MLFLAVQKIYLLPEISSVNQIMRKETQNNP